MKSAFLLASAVALASCGDFWGFDSIPVDSEDEGGEADSADTARDTPAEPTDGGEEQVQPCASDGECSDGELCNGQEICSIRGSCEAGEHPPEAAACTLPGGDAGLCSGGLCTPPGCGNGLIEEGEECDDGNSVVGDGCDPDCAYSCHAAADCFPTGPDPCVEATCEDVETGKGCRFVNLDGNECEDGDACTGGDLCLGGACVGQVTLDCYDGVNCTIDTCDPDRGCVFLPSDELCDDHDPCTIDSCRSSSGTELGCNHDPSTGGPCDDHYFCTLIDTCGDNGCQGQGSPCNDGIDCTEDLCYEDSQSCASMPMSGYCLIDGVCVPHLQTNPGNECLVCDIYTDTTQWSNAANGSSCSACVSPCPCGPGVGECVCCNGVCGALHNCPALP